MDYIACLVEFGGHNLNGFTPNSTSQIGCKSIQITLPVKGHTNVLSQ